MASLNVRGVPARARHCPNFGSSRGTNTLEMPRRLSAAMSALTAALILGHRRPYFFRIAAWWVTMIFVGNLPSAVLQPQHDPVELVRHRLEAGLCRMELVFPGLPVCSTGQLVRQDGTQVE